MPKAIVTAAASGIGLAVARALVADGWQVFSGDADDEAVERVRHSDPGISSHVCDVSDKDSVQGFVARVESQLADHGPSGIDLLVNNAGIAGPTARLEDQPLDQWDKTIAINLNGSFYMTRAVIPLLRKSGRGASIINMGSSAGLFGCPLRAPYVASKWALIGLTKTLAMELGPEGIRVNAICPGSVEGPRIDRVIAADADARGISPGEVEAEYKRQISLRTFVTQDDVVGMIRFLVSPAGARISGQALSLDGHTESLSLDLES